MAEFDVKTISCSSKITAKIEVNIGSLDREYNYNGNDNELAIEKTFTIDSGNGSKYTANFFICDILGQDKFLVISIPGGQKLVCGINMVLYGTITQKLEIEFESSPGSCFKFSDGDFKGKIKSLKAHYTEKV